MSLETRARARVAAATVIQATPAVCLDEYAAIVRAASMYHHEHDYIDDIVDPILAAIDPTRPQWPEQAELIAETLERALCEALNGPDTCAEIMLYVLYECERRAETFAAMLALDLESVHEHALETFERTQVEPSAETHVALARYIARNLPTIYGDP